jgi:hypothetical protein
MRSVLYKKFPRMLKSVLRILILTSDPDPDFLMNPDPVHFTVEKSVLRIRDVYPGSRILILTHPGSRIPDPKTATKERVEKKSVVIPFYVATNFTKSAEENNLPNFQRIIELFTQKIVTKFSKIWVWDPRSGIRKKPFPDPGSGGQRGTGSRIRIRNTEKLQCF